jgi:small subunit ribosomal protein S6
MAFYETVFIARQDVSAKQVEDLAGAFTKIVNDNGGEVKNTESWGLRTLAYKIKKNRKGHYTLLHMDAPPAAIAEMERNMKLNDDVLRYMTVRIDALPEGPSAILKQSDDDDRGPRGERGGFRRERNDRGSGRPGGNNDDNNNDDSSEGDE